MRYKFLNLVDGKIKSNSGNHTWEIGKWYTHKGEVKKCEQGFHCSTEPLDALSYVKGGIIAIVETKGVCDKEKDKECWESMKITKAYYWDKTASVKLAIFAAEQVIDIYEKKYPDDSRPRKAIEAAKYYLENPSDAAADAAAHAAHAAYAAADAAADAAAYAAAYAAHAAAHAAHAAHAAYAAADAACAAYAAYAAHAAHAAYAAADAATKKVNAYMKKLIKELKPYETK